jgi:succinate dehydrogenase / fumarate reductase flavoprotein subunit
MGGLWVDYELMSNVPGLFVLGEANFSDHGANRLGASALMQGLADGYFIVPYTMGAYLASATKDLQAAKVAADHPACKQAEGEVTDRLQRLLAVKGKRGVQSFHRELGKVIWDDCGMARTEASLKKALAKIPEIREEFWKNVSVPGGDQELNQSLEQANRVADFLEFAELICHDALDRRESCGAHFREEYQTPEGEAQRNDAEYAYVAAWVYQGADRPPALHKEPLQFENVHLTERSYK